MGAGTDVCGNGCVRERMCAGCVRDVCGLRGCRYVICVEVCVCGRYSPSFRSRHQSWLSAAGGGELTRTDRTRHMISRRVRCGSEPLGYPQSPQRQWPRCGSPAGAGRTLPSRAVHTACGI